MCNRIGMKHYIKMKMKVNWSNGPQGWNMHTSLTNINLFTRCTIVYQSFHCFWHKYILACTTNNDSIGKTSNGRRSLPCSHCRIWSSELQGPFIKFIKKLKAFVDALANHRTWVWENYRKTIDFNGWSVKKHSMVMVQGW